MVQGERRESRWRNMRAVGVNRIRTPTERGCRWSLEFLHGVGIVELWCFCGVGRPVKLIRRTDDTNNVPNIGRGQWTIKNSVIAQHGTWTLWGRSPMPNALPGIDFVQLYIIPLTTYTTSYQLSVPPFTTIRDKRCEWHEYVYHRMTWEAPSPKTNSHSGGPPTRLIDSFINSFIRTAPPKLIIYMGVGDYPQHSSA